MNRTAKLIILALFLALLPMKQQAQTARHNNVVIDISEIANPDYRYCLMSAIANDGDLVYTVDDDNISLIVSSASRWDDNQLQSHFDRLKAEAEAEFATFETAEKETRGEMFDAWKNSLPEDIFVLLFRQMLIENPTNRDGNQTCATSDPFCTTDVVTFNVAANPGGYCENGPYYGCLSSYTDRPPFWFHMKIGVAGAFQIKMSNSSNVDIDFCCWGPFDDPVTPCPSQLNSGKYVSCGSSSAHTEYCDIPSSAQVGKYYIMVITKYNQSTATNITFQKVAGSGPGETDCGILPGIASNDGPYCVGETIHLNVNAQTGATYSWTGPNGFTSNQQNPVRSNCTMAMAGTYTCVTTVGSHSTTATTVVEIIPKPTANFSATTVCAGSPTQFTNTSTSNPTGQTMTYLWDFGDGGSSTSANPSHTYAQAGTYEVSLTASCGGDKCTNTRTHNVVVNANPVANAGRDQTITYGGTAQLSGSGGAGTFNFHWEPANMVTNANAQNTQTVTLTSDQTFTLTVSNVQGQCTSTDQVTIHISGSSMTATASASPSTICQGHSTQLQANAGGGTGNFSYSWSPTTGLSDPNISNPLATPSQTTTYTCTVSDGQTTQNVDATVTVNMPEYNEETHFVCPGDVFVWDLNGHQYSEAGQYTYQTTTAQGCDKFVTLNLQHYPTYDETVVTEAICAGETYNFHGIQFDNSVTGFPVTLQSAQGCDSIVRLNLTVWPDNEVTTNTVTVCHNQLPYTFYGEDYYDEADVTVWDTDIHGCDSAVRLVLNISNYYMPNIHNAYVCSLPYLWEIRDDGNNLLTTKTITQPGAYCDTLPTSTCEGIFRLNLHYKEIPETEHHTEVACDSYFWPMSGDTYHQSGTYTHSFPIYEDPANPGSLYPCTEDHVLHLTVNKSGHATRSFDKECDFIEFDWFGQTHTFTHNDSYTFTGENALGCDSIMTVTVTDMEYTPNPSKIRCTESNAVVFGDTIAVITNTEFFSFNYDFYIEELGFSVWDEVEWSISKESWDIEPYAAAGETVNRLCKVYVADRDDNYVVLTATARNSCGETASTFYLKPSFLDIGEHGENDAEVSIVPNPNNGAMRLNFENMEGRVAVKVYDMTGNLTDTFETTLGAGSQSYDYNMKRYAEGVYFFVVTSNARSLTRKVVVIH